jgi:hypothetical protein
MSSHHKRLVSLAAVALIGVAASSAVFAQAPAPVRPGGPIATAAPTAPQPLQCAPNELPFRTGNGTDDSFAGTADPPPHPTSLFMTAAQLNTATNKYDQTASNYRFGDSFTLNQSGPITKLRLTTRVKSNSSDSNNDGFSFSTQQNFTPGHFSYGFAIGAGPIGWGLLTFDFDRAVNQIKVNTAVVAPAPATYQAINFFGDLDNGRALHIYVQDDTSVDFIRIEGCYKPAPPKYDLVASKKHDGNIYTLNVHNAGSQIMPTGHVDVVEVVPAGLIIDSASGAPWQCPGVVFPVVGPDAFTCTYQIPPGGIPANGNLPPIVLKTEGKSECPNCMRAKLYLKSVSDGVKPVEEGDMKNNASCAK